VAVELPYDHYKAMIYKCLSLFKKLLIKKQRWIIASSIALAQVSLYSIQNSVTTKESKECAQLLIHHLKNNFRTVNDYDSINHAASFLAQIDEIDAAVPYFEKLYKLKPANSSTSYNMAYVLSLLGRHQEAISYYEKTLALDPAFEQAHLGFSKALLALGDFSRGLPEFEHRMEYWENFHHYYKYPTLDLATLTGKKIILLAEWGLGDTFQFIRYAKLLKDAGATVIVQTFAPLVKLLSHCPYIDTIMPQGTLLPKADLRIPLLSLPLVFKTTMHTIPAPIPYLYADPALTQEWHMKLAPDQTFKVGLCWHAKPIYLENHRYTRRSIPLKTFLSLATVPNITIYSLQKAVGTEELLSSMTGTIKNFGPLLDQDHGPFMDTAALIKNLDLVLSVDTSIVHLAGGLGTPIWVLLPYNAEWRWLHDRTDSPWYPSIMRLFRQSEPGNWNNVLTQIKTELETLVKKRDTAQSK
jgi:tetratricopeptide (TPR) repeat protein